MIGVCRRKRQTKGGGQFPNSKAFIGVYRSIPRCPSPGGRKRREGDLIGIAETKFSKEKAESPRMPGRSFIYITASVTGQ